MLESRGKRSAEHCKQLRKRGDGESKYDEWFAVAETLKVVKEILTPSSTDEDGNEIPATWMAVGEAEAFTIPEGMTLKQISSNVGRIANKLNFGKGAFKFSYDQDEDGNTIEDVIVIQRWKYGDLVASK